jgi:BA14K-like protein
MPFFAYIAIVVVALFSVALEWDTLIAPSDSTVREMQAMSLPGAPPVQRDAVQPPPAADEQKPKAAALAPPPVNAGAVAKTGGEAQKTAAPQCDVAACTAAYRTFRASDCTYAPSYGVRKLCTKGVPDAAEAQAVATPPPATVPGCHVRACAEAYSTFNPADCTYQPIDGPRRVCEK